MFQIVIPTERFEWGNGQKTLQEIHLAHYQTNVKKTIDNIRKDGKGGLDRFKDVKALSAKLDWPVDEAKTIQYFNLFEEYIQLDDLEKNLLVAKPTVLRSFIQKEYDECNKMNITDELWQYWRALLGHVFNYDGSFSKKKKDASSGKNTIKSSFRDELKTYKWNAGLYLAALDIHSCCYCNADITYSKEFTRQDTRWYCSSLDHFYPKSLYPYLAISLYNLVPVCERCNSKFKLGIDTFQNAKSVLSYFRKNEKGKKEDKCFLLNPFDEGLHDLCHFVRIIPSSRLAGRCPTNAQVALLPYRERASKVNCNRTTFAIDEVYNELYGFVIQDVLRKRYLLEEGFGKWLIRKMNLLSSHLLEAVEDIGKSNPELQKKLAVLEKCFREDNKRLLFGDVLSLGDGNKRPFFKLTFDLAGDL